MNHDGPDYNTPQAAQPQEERTEGVFHSPTVTKDQITSQVLLEMHLNAPVRSSRVSQPPT